MALLCETVGSVYVAVAERTPEHKGKIERYFDTAERRGKLGLLPGSTAGTKSHQGRDPHRAHPLSAEQFEELLRREIHQHNFERVHSALGVTPWQRWCGESTPLIEPDVDETAVFVPIYDDPTRTHPDKRGMRKVEKRGVHVDNTYYIAPEIDWLVGKKQKVRVHALQGRPDFVDVWVEDPGVEPRFVGRCVPHHRLTDDQRRNILRGRVDTYLTTQAVVDAAADRNVEAYTDIFAEADAAVAAVDDDADDLIVLDGADDGDPLVGEEARSDTCDPSTDHGEPTDDGPEPVSPPSGTSLRDLSVASDPYLSTNEPDTPSEEHP